VKDFEGIWSGSFLEYVGEDTPQFEKGGTHLVTILISSMKPCIQAFTNERIELENLNPSDWKKASLPNDYQFIYEKED
jgi:hypothetical protein